MKLDDAEARAAELRKCGFLAWPCESALGGFIVQIEGVGLVTDREFLPNVLWYGLWSGDDRGHPCTWMSLESEPR